MTYLQFHLVFIVPAILVLGAVYSRRLRSGSVRPTGRWIALLCAIAFVYTTPWDNYLVAREVWWYHPDRVLGTVGYVPVEEYAFFILQPVLTGLWLAVLPRWERPTVTPQHRPRIVGGLLSVLVALAGALMLRQESTLYMGLILAWAFPIVAVQWAWYGDVFMRNLPRLAAGVGGATLYLWIADRVAIGLEIWIISPEYTTGLHLFGLPIEEAMFFLVTNMMVVQGIAMLAEPREGTAARLKAAR